MCSEIFGNFSHLSLCMTGKLSCLTVREDCAVTQVELLTLQLEVGSSRQNLLLNPSAARHSFTCSSWEVKVLCKTTSSPCAEHTHTQMTGFKLEKPTERIHILRSTRFHHESFCWIGSAKDLHHTKTPLKFYLVD